MADSGLHGAFDAATAAVAAARAAPLSAKKALLAALLVDQAADALFTAARGGQGDDLLAFRADLAAASKPLALVFAVAARNLDLVTESVEIEVEDYPALEVEDFMVSLYNGRTVQRVLVAASDGRHDIHAVLAAALGDLGAQKR